MEAADLSAASPCRRTADALSACKISSPAKRHRPAGEAPTPGMRIQSVQAAPSPFERPAPHLFAARSSSAGDEDAMSASRGPFLFGQQFNSEPTPLKAVSRPAGLPPLPALPPSPTKNQ